MWLSWQREANLTLGAEAMPDPFRYRISVEASFADAIIDADIMLALMRMRRFNWTIADRLHMIQRVYGYGRLSEPYRC